MSSTPACGRDRFAPEILTSAMSDPQNPNPFESSDPADQTQRNALPPAAGEPGRYSPAPEHRSDWAQRAARSSPSEQPTQERWYEPASPAPPSAPAHEKTHGLVPRVLSNDQAQISDAARCRR